MRPSQRFRWHTSIIDLRDSVKWRAALVVDDAGILPSSQQSVRQAASAEEGQIVNVAGGQQMPNVEARAAAIESRVIRVNDGIQAIGAVINRVAVRIGKAKLQRADDFAGGELQPVIDGGGAVFAVIDVAIADKGAEGIRVGPACYRKINGRLSGYGSTTGRGAQAAINRFPGQKWILVSRS